MKIEGLREFLSIKPFEPIDLPPLTILVGPNGSGKTHLLQAIEQGAVSSDLFLDETGQRAGYQVPWGQVLRLENGIAPHAALLTTHETQIFQRTHPNRIQWKISWGVSSS
ncbi:AAA family ATPase [Aurantimonas sp. C2-6-R+9]|uniref:AAA family ATPase n=1 Tax=unclassified Aurantimonas TaxID=2638230 RepID=UPI002E18CE85|nr:MULTISPECIES: AAA family ATPase [unclassified Aurantimonas]MEC5290589.1 AAA family ATPase [Aurantimonas sp. C2-3-R2]MEC5384034.1 AAA family ATPase [Aurantimonas sp. C2-6-R+9]MEC5411743.1 AAA family ATPase [Aurantimonas sp. C2-4-R8]